MTEENGRVSAMRDQTVVMEARVVMLAMRDEPGRRGKCLQAARGVNGVGGAS